MYTLVNHECVLIIYTDVNTPGNLFLLFYDLYHDIKYQYIIFVLLCVHNIYYHSEPFLTIFKYGKLNFSKLFLYNYINYDTFNMGIQRNW